MTDAVFSYQDYLAVSVLLCFVPEAFSLTKIPFFEFWCKFIPSSLKLQFSMIITEVLTSNKESSLPCFHSLFLLISLLRFRFC